MIKEILIFLLGLVVGSVAVILIGSFLIPPVIQPSLSFVQANSSIRPVFSPDDGNQIIHEIDLAQHSIDIEMFVFTSKETIAAIEAAEARGVQVRLIIEKRDSGEGNEATAAELKKHGVDVKYASTTYKLTHAKFLIIDGKEIIVGSHNLSFSALNKNREASLIVIDQSITRQFESVFETDWGIATSTS
ncbi:phospholipase D family protein [Candidatus Micrarchaeota archaeon]|nr:phospholipase D family protein [Candidatus Micrarchaeota archaeon]